jgi:tRNA pseudouridine13 synthase
LDRYELPIARTGKIVSAESLADTNALIEAGKIRIAFPLVGSRQRLSEGSMGEIQKEVLVNENVNPEEFRVGARRIMSGKGELRQIVSPIKEMAFSSFISTEEVFARREARLSFMLSRGSYATMLLREIMKPSDPVACGF